MGVKMTVRDFMMWWEDMPYHTYEYREITVNTCNRWEVNNEDKTVTVWDPSTGSVVLGESEIVEIDGVCALPFADYVEWRIMHEKRMNSLRSIGG